MTSGRFAFLYPILTTEKPLSQLARSRLKPEQRLACEVATFLQAATLEGRLQAVWCCVRNELPGTGRIVQTWQAVGRAMGIVPGAHDYAFAWEGGAGWLELKVKSPLSDHQKLFARWCSLFGIKTAVCRSVAEVEATLIVWGVL